LSPPPPRHLHQVQTDASVTIRPLVLTPAQRVSHTSAETDVLQLKPAFMRQQVFRRETGGLSMWGGRHFSRVGETVARLTGTAAHTLQRRSWFQRWSGVGISYDSTSTTPALQR
jgi:hypothetical protein